MHSQRTSGDRLRRVWSSGGTAIGVFIFTRLDPVAVESLAQLGFDYVVIDLQHGLMSFSDLLGMLQALTMGDVTPLVRVPHNNAALIGRVLDAGAGGVIVPMVNSPEEAARAVSACRYAPLGQRSFGPLRAGIVHGRGYAAMANDTVLCIPMIETAEAVLQARAICGVAGVAAVYVGPTDLSLTYGLPPALDNANPFADALESVQAAAGAAGIVAGIHASSALAAARHAGGFKMITVHNDMAVLTAGFTAALAEARAVVQRAGGAVGDPAPSGVPAQSDSAASARSTAPNPRSSGAY